MVLYVNWKLLRTILFTLHNREISSSLQYVAIFQMFVMRSTRDWQKFLVYGIFESVIYKQYI